MADLGRLEVELQNALRDIPSDLAEALELEPAMYLLAAARLHGLMSHWSTRMAYAKGTHSLMKVAREVGLDSAKIQIRHTLLRAGEKVTDDIVSAQARVSPQHLELCTQEAMAEANYLRLKGLVDAIVTKREALRLIQQFLRPEMHSAEETYVLPDTAKIPMRPDLEERLRDIQVMSAELEKQGVEAGSEPATTIRVKKGKK